MMAMKPEPNIPPPPGYDATRRANVGSMPGDVLPGRTSNSNTPSNLQVQIQPSASGYSLNEVIGLIMRLVAIILTFIATVIIGASKHSVMTTGLALTDMKANKYFVGANSIVLIYSVATLLMSYASTLVHVKSGDSEIPIKAIIGRVLLIADMVMMAFLFSAVGAASAVRDMIPSDGCEMYLCPNFTAGIVMSVLAAFDYIGIAIVSAINLNENAKTI